MEFFDAVLDEAVRSADLRLGATIVITHIGFIAVIANLHADMAKAVELGADLTDFGRQEFIVPNDFIGAERPPVGVPGMRNTNLRWLNNGMSAL
ncbi:MAG: hypothetical protein U1F68_18965 [Gammaproteobacteria bacterium]